MEEYQDHSLGSRVFQKIRDNILNGTYKENAFFFIHLYVSSL